MRKCVLLSSEDAPVQADFIAIERTLSSEAMSLKCDVLESHDAWRRNTCVGTEAPRAGNNNTGAAPVRSEENGPTREYPTQPRIVARRLVRLEVAL